MAREARLLPLADWPLAERRRITGVFTDIDDTLTEQGAIAPEALAALQSLRQSAIHVIAVTGRPVGWSEPFAWGNSALKLAPWPVDAIVAENGAVALLPEHHFDRKNGHNPIKNIHGQLSKLYQSSTAERRANHARLQAVLARVEAQIPGARRATDSAGRETDIAIDHSEFTQLPPQAIDAVVALMQAEGLRATVSSIHVNGWIGDHDKLQGARWIVQALYGRELADEMDRWAFIGDSTNDQRMFAAFPASVGVANVSRFVPQLDPPPRYLCAQARGRGFAEFAGALLAARQ